MDDGRERARQERVNVHVASILSELGLRAESERIRGLGRRRVPDFELSHPLVGLMLGEAEVGTWEYDDKAKERLIERARERFGDPIFRGYDFILLLIYKHEDLERIAGLDEHKAREEVAGFKVGVGLAVRGEAFQLGGHYTIFRGEPAEVRNIPFALDSLIEEFFSELRRRSPSVRTKIEEFVSGLVSVLDSYSNSLAAEFMKDSNLLERLAEVAGKLSVAWEAIRDVYERPKITFRLLLLLEALATALYWVAVKERYHTLRPLDCTRLTYEGFVNHLETLLNGQGVSRYAELNTDFLGVLKAVPPHRLLDEATSKICVEVVNGYSILRVMGSSVLSLMYQRMLSETYRHAFATFYTKIPAAKLLATLAVEGFEEKVIDPACGTGSLLLAALERRMSLLGGEALRRMAEELGGRSVPILDIAREKVLERTVGLDALKPATLITALNLRIATHGSPPDSLRIYYVPVGEVRAGSLDLLTEMKNALPSEVRRLLEEGFDLVITNPPFTRSDRIPGLIGRKARELLAELSRKGRLTFGSVPVERIFVAGLAKPFMVLADRLVKEGGKIAAVLPTAVLSRPTWRDLREGLVKSYSIEYIVISWAPGTPNFSSDTQLREVLLVARKGKRGGGRTKIIGLLKRIDEFEYRDIELLTREAKRAGDGFKYVDSGSSTIGYVNVVDGALVEGLSDNLYRLIAFKNPQLVKFHLKVIGQNGIKLGDLFQVGSVIDHPSGLRVVKRDEDTPLLYPQPALWGSGESLNVRAPIVDRAPWKVGVKDESEVIIKYWSPERTFYKANLFMLRRGRLNTHYVLAIRVGEDAVSNVWWCLRTREQLKDPHIVEKLLVYMNSTFGFFHLLGERLETEGLFVEYKKEHLVNMLIPDLRRVPPPSTSALRALRSSMPRFDKYLETAAARNKEGSLRDVAEELSKEGNELLARATLDLEVYSWLTNTLGVSPPEDFYLALNEEVEALRNIMEGGQEAGEGVADEPRKQGIAKHRSLESWFKGSKAAGST